MELLGEIVRSPQILEIFWVGNISIVYFRLAVILSQTPIQDQENGIISSTSLPAFIISPQHLEMLMMVEVMVIVFIYFICDIAMKLL